MLSLIVKGARSAAVVAAHKRGLALQFERETEHRETLGFVEDSALGAVIAWFAEDGEAPYPDGSLLFYSVGR